MKHLTFIIFLLFAILTTARAQELNDSQKQQIDGENILKNGGFEAGRTNWTSTTVTPSSSTAVVIKGARSLCFTASSQAFTLYQDSTKYATAFADGVQGLAKARIQTNHSGAMTVCSKQAGTASTTNCVTVQANGKWGQYKIPFILGGTSNGIIISAASGSGTTCIDDAFVGAVDLKQDIDQSRIAGESYFAGTSSCTWSRTSTTVGAFATTSACPGPTLVTDSITMGSWQTTDTDYPKQTINNLPAGKYKATFIFQTIQTTGGTSVFAINDGTTTCEAVPVSNDNASRTGGIVECTFSYTSSGNRTFELYAASTSNTVNINNDLTTPRGSTKFILEYFGSGQIYSASCGAACETHYTAQVSSSGTVTGESSDFVNGNCTVSNTAQYDCPLNSLSNTNKLNCEIAPNLVAFTTVTGSYDLTNSSTSNVRGRTVNSNTGAAFANAFTLTCDKTSTDALIARTIFGTFNEVVTTPGITKPVEYSFKISSTGVVSDDLGDLVNGNCVVTSTQIYTCTLNAGKLASTGVNCVASAYGSTGGRTSVVNSASSTSIVVYTWINGSTSSAGDSSVICHGSAP